MGSKDTTGDPRPSRIHGVVCGLAMRAFYFAKDILGGSQTVGMNGPRLAGSLTIWDGTFIAFNCSMVYLRNKDDPWNTITAAAATGGFLQMRHGLRVASRSAVFGGVLLALVEGAGLMLQRPQPPDIGDDLLPPQKTAEKETKISGETLESFDSPPPTNFEFK